MGLSWTEEEEEEAILDGSIDRLQTDEFPEHQTAIDIQLKLKLGNGRIATTDGVRGPWRAQIRQPWV